MDDGSRGGMPAEVSAWFAETEGKMKLGERIAAHHARFPTRSFHVDVVAWLFTLDHEVTR